MSKKILIVGNGPSITRIDYRRLPDDIAIFRMNNFFFEDKYYLGKKVDYYYTDYGFLKNQFFNIYNLNERKEYTINTILSNGKAKTEYPTTTDITALVNNNQRFREFIFYYNKYYQQWVSGGILSLFAVTELGYNELYMVGFDFYSNENYPWKNAEHPIFQKYVPRDSDQNIKTVIERYHPLEIQLKALDLLKQIGGIKLYSICENTKLNDYIDLAPIINPNKQYLIQNKDSNAMHDWLELPVIKPGISISSPSVTPPPVSKAPVIKNEESPKDTIFKLKVLGILHKIFSVKNVDRHKVFTILGIRVKFRRH